MAAVNPEERVKMLADMSAYIDNNDVPRYCDFERYCRDNRFDWYALLMTSGLRYITAKFDSKKIGRAIESEEGEEDVEPSFLGKTIDDETRSLITERMMTAFYNMRHGKKVFSIVDDTVVKSDLPVASIDLAEIAKIIVETGCVLQKSRRKV
jgi:hypothetical protein